MRFAACDVGTNSCRLLVAEVIDKRLQIISKKVVTTRIGQGVGQSGWLHPVAIARTVDCLGKFSEEMFHRQITDAKVVCTSAVREAFNREDFLVLAEERIGHEIEVLSGEEEGYYSYLGAKKALRMKRNPLVVDVGGGSTEFVMRQRRNHALSLPIGAVRATEGGWDKAKVMAELAQGLKPDWVKPEVPLALVGGTATTLVAMKKKMRKYDPEKVQGVVLTLNDIESLYQKVVSLSIEERKSLPGLQPERADIIDQGILIVKSIIEYLERDHVVVSDSDLLDGIIWTLHEKHVLSK